jgi:hypothetical protein
MKIGPPPKASCARLVAAMEWRRGGSLWNNPGTLTTPAGTVKALGADPHGAKDSMAVNPENKTHSRSLQLGSAV